MAGTDRLVEQARFLRNAAPEQFDRFLDELRSYSLQMTENLIYTTENPQLAQGHAQQCVNLVRALEKVKHG
jgi:hypothetical protein